VVVWRYVSIGRGAQCVILFGIVEMPEWSVNNLDSKAMVRLNGRVVEPACYNYGFYHSCVGAIAFKDAHFGQGFGFVSLDQVECLGFEFRLAECRSLPRLKFLCSHEDDAGVQCELLGLRTMLMLGRGRGLG
jgi:hypothetical protein